MSEIREILSDFFNGRPAKVVRVRLTDKQIQDIAAGKLLEFKAGELRIELVKK